jgi:hypothetical protein
MFTGFASENTPAIQIWDFAVTTANPFIGPGNVSLQDDCAPIQFFKTGGTSSTINIYLPSAPIEGKQIKIINARYGSNSGTISIFSSDVSGGGTSFKVESLFNWSGNKYEKGLSNYQRVYGKPSVAVNS